MRQLFFKAYLTVLALTAVGLVLTLLFITLPLLLPVEWQDFTEGVEVEYRLLKPELMAADSEAEMQRIISTYQPVFDLKATLVKPSDLSAVQQTKLQASTANRILSEYEEDDWYAYYRLPGRALGLLLIEDSEFNWEQNKLDLFLLIVLPFLFIMGTLAFALIFTLRRLSQPLLALEATALQLGSGDMTARVSSTNTSPLNSLSTTFNHMADSITELITRQQIMIAAIPHELRTPLNRIRFALDMSRSKQDVAGLRQSIEKMDGYVEDLSTAVQDILELNRLQQSGQQLPEEAFTQTQLAPLLDRVAATCEASDKQFVVQCAPELTIRANSALLHRALLNLAQNAAIHAKQNIVLSAQPHVQGGMIIRIDDDGAGVPETERKQIFMPTHRLDSSRNRSTGGIGLGLALVASIIAEHVGTIEALTSPAGGLRMEIRLPA